jgi:hypothetical protein
MGFRKGRYYAMPSAQREGETMKIFIVLLLTIATAGGISPVFAQDEGSPSGVDGTITLQNISHQEWRIVETEGEGVFSGGNAQTVILEIGGRYYFDVSEVDSEFLPLDFRGHRGRILFSQSDDAIVEDLEGLNIQADENGVTFTLTEELAREMVFFRATPYPQMTGIIASYDPTAAIEDDENEGDGDGEDEEGGA